MPNLSVTLRQSDNGKPLRLERIGYVILTGLLLIGIRSSAFAQHLKHKTKMSPAEKPATLVPGMGAHHHPISTTNPEAQKFFDQGLSFVYAFNHDEAVRSFKRAAELDPQMAMAHWGIALALGPNINLDVDPEREKAAFDAVQTTLALADKAPENERAYIEALTKRYSIDAKADLKKLALDYKNAMGDLVKRYPDDLDAATLYAEAAMNLRPWQLWTLDGKPADGTEEIVTVLESVLKRDPNHIGANHYYIHAVEASPSPARALASARRISFLVPGAGHLVHMPAHIFMRTGNYRGAAVSNRRAAEVDEAYFRRTGHKGVYPVIYYTHNLHFLAVAHGMEGRLAGATRAAKRLETALRPHLRDKVMMESMLPMIELYAPTAALVLVRFNQWKSILLMRKPDHRLPATNGLWRFSRGMALARTGRIEKAKDELKLLREIGHSTPAGAMTNFNKASSILDIAEKHLRARIAEAEGESGRAIDLLQEATEIEDGLAYDEPPAWYLSAREAKGGVLVRNRQYEAAEKVFRADLEKNPLHGRSLFGLMEALKAQNKTYAARLVQREFENAWKNSEIRLRIEDL